MAKLNIEQIFDHLDREIRKALDATLREHFSDVDYTSRAVYKTFKEQLGKKCNAWESIPNKYIRSE